MGTVSNTLFFPRALPPSRTSKNRLSSDSLSVCESRHSSNQPPVQATAEQGNQENSGEHHSAVTNRIPTPPPETAEGRFVPPRTGGSGLPPSSPLPTSGVGTPISPARFQIEKESPPFHPAHLRRILVPTDFSDPALKSLEYAVALCQSLGIDGPEVILLHAVEPLPYPDEFGLGMRLNSLPLEPWKARLEELSSAHVPPSLRGSTHVRLGIPFQVICETAKSEEIDLLVIATHGHTGIRRLLLGSTTEKVVRHAPCPVLVVREREHDFVHPDPFPEKPKA